MKLKIDDGPEIDHDPKAHMIDDWFVTEEFPIFADIDGESMTVEVPPPWAWLRLQGGKVGLPRPGYTGDALRDASGKSMSGRQTVVVDDVEPDKKQGTSKVQTYRADPPNQSINPEEETWPAQRAAADDPDRVATLLSTPVSQFEIPLAEDQGQGFGRLGGEPDAVSAASLVRRQAFAGINALMNVPAVKLDNEALTYLRRTKSSKFWLEHRDSTLALIMQDAQKRTRTKLQQKRARTGVTS